MESITASGIPILFPPGEEKTAEWIGQAIERGLPLIQKNWGLASPTDCRIFVMTSGIKFFFQSAPWNWRIFLAISMPFWLSRVQRTWPYSAAWTQRYGRRTAIGIKPPPLLAASDKRIGIRMFVEELDTTVKLQHLTCHELTHACSAHLRLPAWLNEGIAAVTVDRFLGKQTIRTDTLDVIRKFSPKERPPTYRELSRLRGEAIVYHSVRGYWLVRYLEGQRPGLLKRILSTSRKSQTIEDEIAVALGVDPDEFWKVIDGRMVEWGEAEEAIGD